MSVIFCSFKTDFGNSCGCRKHCLFCNAACKNCAGCNCTNIDNFEEQDDKKDESSDLTGKDIEVEND